MAIKLKQKIFVVSLLLLLLLLLWLIYKYKNVSDSFTNNIEYYDWWDEPDHMKVGIKFLILAAILVLGYKNVKKPAVSTKVWAIMIALAVVNLVIALAP